MRIKYCLFLVFCAICLTATAQVPRQINYQAVIRNASGTPVPNKTISLKFTFLAGASNGTPEYSETQSVTTNSFGLVNLQIGTGTVLTGTWDDINWNGSIQYLSVAADLSGGNTYTDLSNSKLSSVPYALQSEHSNDNQWTLNGGDIINKNTGAVGIGAKPDASAALDITASGKGLLIPRMKQAERPASPAEGLLIYQTDNTPGFYYYSSGQWQPLQTPPPAPAGTIIPLASSPMGVTFTTSLAGSSTGAAIGFGSNVPVQYPGANTPIDFSTVTGEPAFVLPRDGTITSISGFFKVSSAAAAIGSTFVVTGQLYQTLDPSGSTFYPVPGAIVNLTPNLTDLIMAGQTVSGSISGLSIPVTSGNRLLMIYTLYQTGGIGIVTTVTGTINGGINIQ